MSLINAIQYKDSASLDAFGRVRQSSPITEFEGSFEYSLQPFFFDTYVSGGTIFWDINMRSAILNVTGASGSKVVLQSKNYLVYQKGKSQYIKETFVLEGGVANVKKRIGYFDENNGIFFQQDGATLSITLRSSVGGSVVDTTVSQGDWNKDSLTGISSPSGISLNVFRQQILTIDAQFLGAGRIRTGFNIDGAPVYAHWFNNANSNDTAPYMQTFNLPVRYEIESVATTTGSTLQAICCEVESEGGSMNVNALSKTVKDVADVTVSTTPTALIQLRPKLTYGLGASVPNHSFISLEGFGALAGNNSIELGVYYNATTAGGSWISDGVEFPVEYNNSLTGVCMVNAVLVDHIYVGSNNTQRGAIDTEIKSQYPLTIGYLGSSVNSVTLVANTTALTSASRGYLSYSATV